MSHTSYAVLVAGLLAATILPARAQAEADGTDGPAAGPATIQALLPPTPGRPRVVEPGPARSLPERLADRWLAQRLVLGSRLLALSLRDNQRGEPYKDSFIGSIDRLDAVQRDLPDRFFVQFAVLPFCGVGFQRDRLQIKTRTTIPREFRIGDRDTDGDAVLHGDLPYLFVRWPNRTPVTPFVEYGQAKYRSHFRPNQEWYADGRREFILEPRSTTTYWGGGVEIELHRHCALDLYVRTMDLDVPGEYHFRGDDRDPEPFVFTARHVSYGVGLRALF